MTQSSHRAFVTDGLTGNGRFQTSFRWKSPDVMHQHPQSPAEICMSSATLQQGLMGLLLTYRQKTLRGKLCLICPSQVPCGAKEAAVHAMARAECCTNWCSASQLPLDPAHLTHQEDHSLGRLYYSSTLDQVRILPL